MPATEKGGFSPPNETLSPSLSGERGAGADVIEAQESWATRNGLTLRSFQKKDSGANIELERPMKTRHLHMISIGQPPLQTGE